jgi:hypothetical protein
MSGRDVASGGLITWGYLFAAKKWSHGSLLGEVAPTGHPGRKMVGIPT